MIEDFDKMRDKLKNLKDNKDQQYKDNSKRRLLVNLQKKFNTTIIGSLAVFEEFFGDLWGHGKAVEDLTWDEQEWRKIWSTARSRILDNGNSNLRAAQNEIAQYTLHWDRYVVQMPVKQVKKED
jgi:hypothetical protein